MSTDGTDLPSANIVANQIHRPSYAEDRNFTVMLAVWGQFMDHDITATALSRGSLLQLKNVYTTKINYSYQFVKTILLLVRCLLSYCYSKIQHCKYFYVSH